MPKTVAIQGYQASFHDVAAHKMLGNDLQLIPCETFVGVFRAVMSGEADYGVIAVENSIYGPIHESQALFNHYTVHILDTTDVLVGQCLIAVPGAALEDIRQIYSHPVALAQCQGYLADHLPMALLTSHADTAGAVADIAAWQNPHIAAIAGKAAAELYGMQIVAENIQAEKHNVTTFRLFVAA
jgi:prephenate dehydratase